MATPFKMKSSPTKGKLGDFFRNITKKATPETKAKRVEAKSTRKAGESQYKADVRTRRATNKASKKVDKGELTKNIVNTSQKGDEAVRPKKVTVANKPKSKGDNYNFSGKKGDKFKYRLGPHKKDGSNAQFQRPGSKTWESSKTRAGSNAIRDLYIDDATETTSITPIEKRKQKKKK